jgi:hypothetical protein
MKSNISNEIEFSILKTLLIERKCLFIWVVNGYYDSCEATLSTKGASRDDKAQVYHQL